MSETTAQANASTAPEPGDPGRTPGMAASRQERFARDLDTVGHRTSSGDRRMVLASAAVMVVGIVVAIAAYVTSTSQSDSRDVMSAGILALVGLSLVVAGGAVFVRSSMTQFLRFWMLRLLYEQQRDPGDD